MIDVPRRRVDGFLQIHAHGVPQEERYGPLVLLVAARRAERHIGLPVAQHQAGRQGGARALAGLQLAGHAIVQPGHLQPGGQRKAQAGHDGAGRQPAARGRGGHHVAVAVDNVDLAGVAHEDFARGPFGHGRQGGERGLAHAKARIGSGQCAVGGGQVGQAGGQPVGAAGPEHGGRRGADEGSAFAGIGVA
ncbi:hypothetical protein D3C73_1010450 [compost metagenome]